jgi:hypothetical protein
MPILSEYQLCDLHLLFQILRNKLKIPMWMSVPERITRF